MTMTMTMMKMMFDSCYLCPQQLSAYCCNEKRRREWLWFCFSRVVDDTSSGPSGPSDSFCYLTWNLDLDEIINMKMVKMVTS